MFIRNLAWLSLWAPLSPLPSAWMDGGGKAIFKALRVYLYRPRLLCSPRGFLLEGIYLTHCVLPLWGNKEEKILKLGCFARPPFTPRSLSLFLSPISSLHLWRRKISLKSVTKRPTSRYEGQGCVHTNQRRYVTVLLLWKKEQLFLDAEKHLRYSLWLDSAIFFLRYLGTSPC